MTKRSHGEGTLYKRPNGSYTARVTIEGKRLDKTFKLRKDAQEWIKTISGQSAQGLTFDSSRTTVNELLTEWLRVKATQFRPATNESYSRMARLYIKPALGKMMLKDLTAARVQSFYGDLEKRGVGMRSIELTHTIFHGFLTHAHRLGLVAQNWSDLVQVPRRKRVELRVWDENQVNLFLQYVHSDVFYRLAFATGMRRGELLGLQWRDLDLASGMIKVTRQLYRPEGGGFIFQTPKSGRGTRAIRLGTGLLDALRLHFTDTIPYLRTVAGDAWQEYDLIFPAANGLPRDNRKVLRDFKNLAADAGLPPIRLHDIRHTAASIMLLHGEPPVRVAGILGQSVSILLSTYSHYIPDNQETAANLMDAITTVNSIELENEKRLSPIVTKNP